MDSEMLTYLVIGLVVGLIIGIILTNVLSPKSRKYNQAKSELNEAKQEIAAQKKMIVKHFSHSAEILDNMAKEFRRLYQHMADNSHNLLSQEDLDTLKNSPSITFERVEEQDLDNQDQPKDYSNNPSGLLKNEENKS